MAITLARRLLREACMASISLALLYMTGNVLQGSVRLCFAKPDAVLAEAADRLIRWRQDQKAGSIAPL